MKNIRQNKKGQFIIIAVMLIAVMIISLGALMHTSVTYYKHEPWEEYSTLIGDIELNSHRLIELSLATYTNTLDQQVLKDNLEQWQRDLSDIYFQNGISLGYTLMDGTSNINGINLNFVDGLATSWNKTNSASAARVAFALNISSIGLTGYEFTTTAFLELKVFSPVTEGNVTLAVKEENQVLITDLSEDNFRVNLNPVANFSTRYFDSETYPLVYNMGYSGDGLPIIELWDQRGVRVVAKP
ncbi:hypothetical protein E2P63_03955 [Candidatus Bathyarchaeota archaeon]|nr:hypothetical protein E2P63_03955 [Candidatus Bathyarchaeota archaeon]